MSAIKIEHAIVVMTETTLMELVRAVQRGKQDGDQYEVIVTSDYSPVRFKIAFAAPQSQESLGYQ